MRSETLKAPVYIPNHPNSPNFTREDQDFQSATTPIHVINNAFAGMSRRISVSIWDYLGAF
jgi:hypothetical protein